MLSGDSRRTLEFSMNLVAGTTLFKTERNLPENGRGCKGESVKILTIESAPTFICLLSFFFRSAFTISTVSLLAT